MSGDESGNLWAAYELLVEDVGREIKRVNRLGSQAFDAGDHEAAKRALARAESLKELQGDLEKLGQRLRPLVGGQGPVRRSGTRLRKGQSTPQHAYRLPILRALVELGGRAPARAVLDRVYAAMKDRLSEYDLAPLPRQMRCLRWRKAAEWACHSLRTEGLVRSDSPRGIWEVSQAGRAWLTAQEREGQ